MYLEARIRILASMNRTLIFPVKSTNSGVLLNRHEQ